MHPTFQAMLGHLRSRYLDKFKNDLEQSLKGGKGFAASACSCTQSCMLEFDQGCTGNIFFDIFIATSSKDLIYWS